jgi:hypothetical protein
VNRGKHASDVLSALAQADAVRRAAHSTAIGTARDLDRARAAHERAQANEETARRAYDAARAAVAEAYPAAVSR